MIYLEASDYFPTVESGTYLHLGWGVQSLKLYPKQTEDRKITYSGLIGITKLIQSQLIVGVRDLENAADAKLLFIMWESRLKKYAAIISIICIWFETVQIQHNLILYLSVCNDLIGASSLFQFHLSLNSLLTGLLFLCLSCSPLFSRPQEVIKEEWLRRVIET